MRKAGSGYLVAALALLLLALIVLLPSGAGPGALPREMGFWIGVQNSLWNLDLAKMKWMEENHKTEGDLPTMEDLAPHLGKVTNQIAQLVAWGVEYQITPISGMESQSDVATLIRDVRFQTGFCRFYRSGTRYSLQGGYVFPPYDTKSSLVACYQNNRGSLGIASFASAIGSLLSFVLKKRFLSARRISDASAR